MIRHAILVSLLVLVGSCVDQDQSDVGTVDQAITTCPVGGPCYSNIVPMAWNAREFNSVWDYWAPPPAGGAVVPNLQMVAFVVNGEAAVRDVNGATIAPATRLVWLISNRGVFRVYEVAVSDVGLMEQTTRNAFTAVENYYAAASYASPGSTIIVGVDGGVIVPKKGGPPHGYPMAVVNAMNGYAATVRPVITGIQNAVYYE